MRYQIPGTLMLVLAMGSQVAVADTYKKSPCNAVHWTHMLEGRILLEAHDRKPLDIESLSFNVHDLPPNHRIIHVYDDEVADHRPDRLTIYVDRENIFMSAYCM
ncbi:hypothetical protein IWW37_000429 [Coemansia sp. RSA 2050]|nr:hypothetical protein IWW37_000429 [Coemansia sp. RSA 2050]